MPGILDRISAALGGSTRGRAPARTEERFSVDQWVSDFLVPFTYNGVNYVSGGGSYAQQRLGDTVAEITNTLPAYAAALRSAPPAFAAELVRSMILSQARFVFRNRQNSSSPRRTFGTRALSILEEPDPSRKLTSAKMLGIAEWHAGVAGNAFVYRQAGRRPGGRPVLRNLRPDWTAVIWGSQAEPERAASALDNELLGYVYWNGGYGNGSPWTILPSECAHWAPIPDPENPGLGQSWVTPALREMQGDRAATEHKLTFFRNGATPSLLVKGIAGSNGQPLTKPQFDEVVDMMEARHSGSTNAYKTLYLTGGADATVIGTDLKQVDFTAVQGRGETRVAFLSRVPASLLGISEGMQGSALNAGNFGMARRIFADSWVYPTLQDLAGALSAIVDVPSDAELWFDVSDMPILREDSKDQAEIQQIQAGAISSLINAGYEPASVVRCVQMGDLSQLKHTGLYSVQLQPPQPGQIGAPGEAAPELPPPVDGGETVPPEDRSVALIGEARSSLERSRRRTRRGGGRPVLAIEPGSMREPDALSGQQWRDAIRAITAADRPDDEPIGELDEDCLALLQALDELSGEERARKFNPADHPRNPKGGAGGGRFRSLVDRVKDAIAEHKASSGKGDPFAGFDREQLRKVAKSRGIELKRGEHEDSIKKKLLDDLGEPVSNNPRVQALADKQEAGGKKAAGVGAKEPSAAKKARKERVEAQTNAALDELDAKAAAEKKPESAKKRRDVIHEQLAKVQAKIDRDDENGGVLEKDARDRLEDHKDQLLQELDELDAKGMAKAAPKAKATTSSDRFKPGDTVVWTDPVDGGAQSAKIVGADDDALYIDWGHGDAPERLQRDDPDIDNFQLASDAPQAPSKPEAPKGPPPAPQAPEAAKPGERGDVVSSRPLAGGASATSVDLVTYADGSQAVRKQLRDLRNPVTGVMITDVKHQADAEELGSLVAGALGIPAPGVRRTSDDEIEMDYVEGTVGMDLYGQTESVVSRLRTEDQAVRLGLFDAITDNMDRNAGNWILAPDGRVVSIDHSLSWAFYEKPPGEAPKGSGPFVDLLREMSIRKGVVWRDTARLSPADVEQTRARLEALRPEFEARGRTDWLEASLTRLDGLAPHAKGTGTVLA